MNRGLIEKSLRETWPITLGFGLLFLVLESFLAYVVPVYGSQLQSSILQLDFVRNLLGALIGADLSEGLGPHILAVFPWVHPVVLVVIWAHGITFCTRVPAGEIDRGTIDILLGLPVTRWQVYVCESLVWALSGWALLAMGMLGNLTGSLMATESLPDPGRFSAVVVNLYCLYLAVGAVALALSAMSTRRGRAVGATFAVVVVSFSLNLLAEFWAPAEKVAFLSLLHYYRPLFALRGDGWPLADIMVLLSVGGSLWIAGGVVFHRRDIHTI